MWHTKQYPLDKDILLLPEEKAFQSFEKRLRRTCGYLEFLSWTGLWENSHSGTWSPQWDQWSGWYANTVWIHKGIVYFRGYTSHSLGSSTVLCCSYNIYYRNIYYYIMSVEDGIMQAVMQEKIGPNGTLFSSVSVEVRHLHLWLPKCV